MGKRHPYSRFWAAKREHGYSLHDMAAVVGISYRTLQELVSRDFAPKLRTPKAVADLLGLTLDDLVPPADDRPDTQEGRDA